MKVVGPVEKSCEGVYLLFQLVVVDVVLEAEFYATPLWELGVVSAGYGLENGVTEIMDPEVGVRTEQGSKIPLQLQTLNTQRIHSNPEILAHKLIISQPNINFPFQFPPNLPTPNSLLLSLIESNMSQGKFSPSN